MFNKISQIKNLIINIIQKIILKSKKAQKTLFLIQIPPRNEYGPEESQLSQRKRILAVLFGFLGVLDFKSFENHFLFFFILKRSFKTKNFVLKPPERQTYHII